MQENDTVRLLRECDTGIKMALVSLDGAIDKTGNEALLHLLTQSRREHGELDGEISAQLARNGAHGRDAPMMAKLAAQMKGGVKIGMSGQTDRAIAEFVTDGCNLGVKTLCKQLNQCKNAEGEARQTCGRLVNLEDRLASSLRIYL